MTFMEKKSKTKNLLNQSICGAFETNEWVFFRLGFGTREASL